MKKILTIVCFYIISIGVFAQHFNTAPKLRIDTAMQRIVEDELQNRMKRIDAKWSACILIENHTGEIVAQVFPHDEPMRIGALWMPFGMAACIDAKPELSEQLFSIKSGDGYHFYDEYLVNDVYKRDTLFSVRDILAASSNIGMAQVIEAAYPSFSSLCDACAPLGLHFGHEYGEVMADIRNLTYLYSRIAIDSIPCFSPHSLQTIRKGLHDCVWSPIGTAGQDLLGNPRAQSEYVSIAGKTASTTTHIDENNDCHHHCISFVGYFPEENPKYTCLVLYYNPRHFGYSAGDDCGRTVRNIAERIYKSNLSGCQKK